MKNKDIHWIRPALEMTNGESRKYDGRIRYRQELRLLTIHKKEEGMYITFDHPQRGIAPGQFVAWYGNKELIGSGIIHE